MGRLIVHIGTHKTATTTIQHHLARNRKFLGRRGIWYPAYDLLGWRRKGYAHLDVVNAFSGQHRKLSREDARRFFAEVVARSADQAVTIISAEPFYRHVAGPGSADAAAGAPEVYWQRRERYVEEVRALFAGAEPEIAVVFRRQADYAPSLYQQKVRGTRYHRSFATFRREFWHHFAYLGQAQVWARHFDRLTALRFEDIVASGDPTEGFGRGLGLDLGGPRSTETQNVSLPPDAVLAKRALNAGPLEDAAVGRVMQALLAGRMGARLAARRSLYRSPREMRAYQAGFAADNAALQRTFFSGLPPDAPLFPDAVPRDCVYGDQLDPEVARELGRLGGRFADGSPFWRAQAERLGRLIGVR